VVLGPISAFLSFNSTLESEAAVDLYAQTGGQVEKLYVEEGAVVKAGDPLLKIEDRELRVDVEESAAQFEHLQQGFARQQDLFERNLINKQEFEDRRFQFEQARLRVERAKIRLSYATVRAPFSGVISTREAQVGARVGTGTKLFSLVKLDEIVARVFVPGQYLSVVSENQPALVLSEFLPGRRFSGSVKRISPIVDPRSGTFKVTVAVNGQPGELAPGVFVNVQVVTATRPQAILLPKAAVVYDGGERFVFAVVDGRAQRRKVVAGFENAQHIEALSGFEPGIPVIILGQSGLKEGVPVRMVNPAPAAGPGPLDTRAGGPTTSAQRPLVPPSPGA